MRRDTMRQIKYCSNNVYVSVPDYCRFIPLSNLISVHSILARGNQAPYDLLYLNYGRFG